MALNIDLAGLRFQQGHIQRLSTTNNYFEMIAPQNPTLLASLPYLRKGVESAKKEVEKKVDLTVTNKLPKLPKESAAIKF